jgi:hypothetical protein
VDSTGFVFTDYDGSLKAPIASPTFTGIATSNSINFGLQSVITAAATTTLTNASPHLTIFTGSTTQILVLPNATTLANGQKYKLTNRSTGAITVNMNGGSNLWTIAGTSTSLDLDITLYDNGTAAGLWDVDYRVGNSATGKASTFNNSLTFSGTDGTTMTFPAASSTLRATSEILAYYGGGADSGNTTTTEKFPLGVQRQAIIVDSVHFIFYFLTTPAMTPTISYGPSITAAGTSLGAYSSITTSHATSGVGFGTTIPAGNDMWVVWATATTKPKRWAVIIWGHI